MSLAAFFGCVGLAFSSIPGITGIVGLDALPHAASANINATSTFWSLPTGYLSGAAASAGIAWINSIGNLGGFVSPMLVGRIRDATHSNSAALICLACGCWMSAILVATIFKKRFTPLTN